MKKSRKVILIAVFSCILTVSVSIVCFLTVFTHSEHYVKLDTTKLKSANNQIKIYDDGNGEISEKPTTDGAGYVSLNELPSFVPNAFVAVEDKRFYLHHGVDFRRICGAMLANIKNGSFQQGASTLSQQLIKNTHLTNQKTLQRKLNEAFLAVELENNYNKNEILEMYLNTIYFGRNAYGIEDASEAYFGKSAKQLTLAESATLAGIIKAPNTYSPDKNLQKCLKRRDLILSLMSEQNYVTELQAEQAKQEQIECIKYSDHTVNGYTYYVLNEACDILNMSMQQLCNKKYKIYTYMDASLQNELSDTVVTNGIKDKNNKTVYPSVIISTNNGKIVACCCNGNCNEKRQVGSTAKPFAVYAPALNEKLITTASLVLDEETNFCGYVPHNYGNKYNGWVTVKTAISKSLNVPAVKTLNSLTTEKAQKYLQKMGINAQKGDLSLALGNFEGGITDKQLISAYCVLANGGVYNKATCIKKIVGENGKEIYTDKCTNKRVFKESTAFLMTDMLTETAKNGTASALGKTALNVAGKTGTVGSEKGNTDALVAGYTANYTFVCHYSGDLTNVVTGSSAPCTFMSKIITKIAKASEHFEIPDGVERLAIDTNDLHNNQLVNLASSSDCEYFYFATDNKPQTTALPKVKYQLKATEIDGTIYITMPEIDYQIRLFKVGSGEFYNGNATYYADYNTHSGENSYYAELYNNGKKVYTTPTVTVVIPAKEVHRSTGNTSQENDSKPNILNYWYLR